MVPSHTRPSLLRGSLFACAAVAPAGATHAVAGGGSPDVVTTLTLIALVTAAVTPLANRRRSATATITAMGGVQLALHTVLTISHRPHTLAPPVVDGPVMVVGHAVAAVVLSLLVAKADACLLAVLALACRLLPPLWWPRPHLAQPTAVPVPTRVLDLGLAVVLGRCCARRGPPRSR